MSMIININNKVYETQSYRFYPENWNGEDWIAVPPSLESIIRLHYPYYELVIENGVLLDVIPTEMPVPDLEPIKSERIAQSKSALEDYLLSHPIQWTDGEYYAITQDKQNQLTSTLVSAQVDGEPPEWNSTGLVCKQWDVDELAALGCAIKNRIKALVKYQQAKELEIKAAETMDELNAIVIDYDSVE